MDQYIISKLSNSVSETTLKKRTAFLNELSKLFPGHNDFGFLNNTNDVINRIKKSDNVDTRWNSLFHVLMAIKSHPEVIYDSTVNTYDSLLNELKVIRDAKHLNNVKTEKQNITLNKDLAYRQNEISEKILELFNNADIPFGILTAASHKRIDKFVFAKKLQDLVIAAVYLYQPAIRNDWASLNITNKIKGLPVDKNFIYIKGNTMKLIMNVYKNAKTLGQQIIVIRPVLVNLLKIWLNLLKQVLGESPMYPLYYKITAKKIQHMNNDEVLRRKIPRIMDRLFGAPMSINDFRHLWEIAIQTDPKYATLTLNERKKLHLELLHGTNIAQEYNVQDN